MKKKIFISQQKLESSLVSGQIYLEGSILRSDDFSGHYKLMPALKFTGCASSPNDPAGYVGKCAALAIFEQKGIEVQMNSIDYNGETYEVDEGFLGDYYDEKDTDSPKNEPSEKGVHYDPALITRLNEDHKSLRRLYNEIMKAASKDDYTTVSDKLETFGNKMRTHLMTEQIKFHAYLEQALKNSALTQKMNNNVQKKIKEIDHQTLDFIEKYENNDWSSETKKSFFEGMGKYGKTFADRISMEEDLYELYLPKSAYSGVV